VCSALRVGGNRLFLSGRELAGCMLSCAGLATLLVRALFRFWVRSWNSATPEREREREGLSFSWCVILLIRVKTIFIRKKKKRVKTIFLVPGEIFRFLRARAADPRADLVSQRHPLIRFSGGSVLSDTAKMASAAASYRCGVAGGFVAI
jgi:hypothetical protein